MPSKVKEWIIKTIQSAVETQMIVGRIDRVEAALAELTAIMKWHQDPQSISQLAGTGLPVYVSKNLFPCAWEKRGISDYRAIICSVPRAGTYLTAKLLSLIGLEHVPLHLMSGATTDNRFAAAINLRERSPSPEELMFKIPYSTVLRLIDKGQFVVSHLECSPDTKRDLLDFKKIFVYRNLRDALISHVRAGAFWKSEKDEWEALPEGPHRALGFIKIHGEAFYNMFRSVIGWFSEPDVLEISYEELAGDYGEKRQLQLIERTYEFLSLTTSARDDRQLIKDLLWTPTMTWSGERTKWNSYWNDDVEHYFQSLGFYELNKTLGYY